MEPEDQVQAPAAAEGVSTSEGPAPDQDKGPSRGHKPGDQESHEEEPWRRRCEAVRPAKGVIGAGPHERAPHMSRAS